MTRHQNITAVSTAVESILAERSITLAAEPAPTSAPVPATYVFWHDDPSATRRAQELARAHSGSMAPVAEAMPAGESARARAMRQSWQATYGINAPIVRNANADAAVAEGDRVYVVASLVNGRLAAPLAAFLASQDLASKQVTVEFPAEVSEVSPAAWRTLAELLPRGARIAAVAQVAGAAMTLVAGGYRLDEKFNAAAEHARVAVADRAARAA